MWLTGFAVCMGIYFITDIKDFFILVTYNEFKNNYFITQVLNFFTQFTCYELSKFSSIVYITFHKKWLISYHVHYFIGITDFDLIYFTVSLMLLSAGVIFTRCAIRLKPSTRPAPVSAEHGWMNQSRSLQLFLRLNWSVISVTVAAPTISCLFG